MKFEEYRGVRGLVISELTETVNAQGEVVATYGAVEPLSGVQQVSIELNESAESHYYDDMAAVVVDSEGDDNYTLVVSIPSKATRAKIEGTTYDPNTGALIGTKKNKKYFALGFIGDKVGGAEEYNWIYKGKFTGGNKTHDTKTDGTDATNMEYTYTSIHTAAKYIKANNGSCKYLSVDNDGTADLSDFFDSVTTPDDLQSSTKYDLAITAAEGTTVSVTRNGVAVSAGTDVLRSGDVLTISVTGGTITVNGNGFTSGATLTVSADLTVISTAQA